MDRLTAMEVPVRIVETGSFSGAASAKRWTKSSVHQPLIICVPALAS
jgi:DNA-binding transcriptional LysR family regulator